MKWLVVFAVVSVLACKGEEKKEAEKPATPATPSAPPAPAGPSSMDAPILVKEGAPLEGVITCDGPMWFSPAPLTSGTIKYELSVPEGRSEACTLLNLRDGTGHIQGDAVSTVCSKDPTTFAVHEARFAPPTMFFTIDQPDPNAPCVPARYRMTVTK